MAQAWARPACYTGGDNGWELSGGGGLGQRAGSLTVMDDGEEEEEENMDDLAEIEIVEGIKVPRSMVARYWVSMEGSISTPLTLP